MPLDKLLRVCADCDCLFYKVLSQNDRSWSWPKNRKGYAHQGGILIPDEYTGRIFPRREIGSGRGKDYVADRYYRIHTFWMDQSGAWTEQYEGIDWRRQSKFGRSYKDRPEMRITGGLPGSLFADLTPGSLFVAARRKGSRYGKEYHYFCTVIDAEDQEYSEFLERFVILPPPSAGVIDLRDFRPEPFATPDEIATDLLMKPAQLQLIEAPAAPPKLPNVNELVDLTIREYESRIDQDLRKFLGSAAKPGNVFREIMELGFEILKREQKKVYPLRLFSVLGSELLKKELTQQLLIDILSDKLEDVRKVFKSLNNSVFSIAGNTFERYIRMWLESCSIPFEKGRVDGERSPDFILPAIAYYMNAKKRRRDDAMLLSAKTTCRERYTEILSEGSLVDTRYLATLDNAVPAKSIRKMAGFQIFMIVTERDKETLEQYRNAANVLDYRLFMNSILLPKKKFWGRRS